MHKIDGIVDEETREEIRPAGEEIRRYSMPVYNPQAVAKALELIGRNVAVRAFQDSLEVNHTSNLEEMLNKRGKALEAGARERMKLVTDNG